MPTPSAANPDDFVSLHHGEVVPLVLSTGAGAEMRHAMGVAVFSGMLGVTFFSLLLASVIYVLIRNYVGCKDARKVDKALSSRRNNEREIFPAGLTSLFGGHTREMAATRHVTPVEILGMCNSAAVRPFLVPSLIGGYLVPRSVDEYSIGRRGLFVFDSSSLKILNSFRASAQETPLQRPTMTLSI